MSAPFSLLGDDLPPWLTRRLIPIATGARLAYDENVSRDALVVLERGSLVRATRVHRNG